MPMPVLPRLPRFQRAVDYFYLNWRWRIAEDLHSKPAKGSIGLANRGGTLVRFTIQGNGRSGGGCNRRPTGLSRAACSWPTLRRMLPASLALALATGLSRWPLLLGYGSEKWSPRWALHPVQLLLRQFAR